MICVNFHQIASKVAQFSIAQHVHSAGRGYFSQWGRSFDAFLSLIHFEHSNISVAGLTSIFVQDWTQYCALMSITFTKWTVAVLTVLSITTVQGSSGRFIDLFGLNNEAVQFFGMGFSYPTLYPGSIYEPALWFGLLSIIFAATAITSGQQYLIKFAGRQAGCGDEGKVFDGPVLRKILFRRIIADDYCFASWKWAWNTHIIAFQLLILFSKNFQNFRSVLHGLPEQDLQRQRPCAPCCLWWQYMDTVHTYQGW